MELCNAKDHQQGYYMCSYPRDMLYGSKGEWCGWINKGMFLDTTWKLVKLQSCEYHHKTPEHKSGNTPLTVTWANTKPGKHRYIRRIRPQVVNIIPGFAYCRLINIIPGFAYCRHITSFDHICMWFANHSVVFTLSILGQKDHNDVVM